MRRAFRFFLVNLTILPFDIWIIDPIVRAYEEFGRFLIILRVFVLIGLVAASWFGINHFNLTGIIAIVVVTTLIERFISTTVLLRKLEVSAHDWRLLADVGKTAFVSLFAGIITYLVYRQAREFLPAVGENLTGLLFTAPKKIIVDFIAGSLILAVSFAVFVPIYLFTMNRFNLIDEGEKSVIKHVFRKFTDKFRRREAIINS